MASPEAWTILRLLEWTTQFLQQHGSDSPRLDAEVLLAHARRCTRIELYTSYDERADAGLLENYRQLVRQRATGMPVAYLVGSREFYSLSFKVTRDVLIPRPETEFLIIALLDLVRQSERQNEPLVIADVGTGSGVLAVCAATQLSQAKIWAVDISPEALSVAQHNCRKHGVDEQVQLLESDLMGSVDPQQRFDFIVSNPPYVSESEYAALDPTVRDFEPRQALLAGPEGTEVIVRLIESATDRLATGGWILLEISPMIEEPVRRMMEATGRFTEPQTIPDLAGLARAMMASIRS